MDYSRLISSDASSGLDRLTVPAFINGKHEILPSTLDVISPYTDEPVWRASAASVDDAIRAVEAASAAFVSWSDTKPEVRQQIIYKAADILERQIADLSRCQRTETGTSIQATDHFMMPGSIGMLRDIAARTTSIESFAPSVLETGQSAIVHKVPYGVILSIVPWNAAIVFSTKTVGAALAAGCTTVLKVSELAPRSYWMFAKAFDEAGLPPGVLNVITCRPEHAGDLAKAMIEHRAVRKVTFTGSVPVGRSVAVLCAQNLKPSLMELGGKAVSIVLDDADMQKAAIQIAIGGFANQGATCMCTDKIIVHENAKDVFVQIFSAVLGQFMPATGDPPLIINDAGHQRLTKAVQEAKQKGAVELTGGWSAAEGAKETLSCAFRPVVLDHVDRASTVWRDENFGPVVSIMTVKTDEEAIQLANDTDYGLSSAVFTEDLRRAFKIAKRLEVGQVHINNASVHDEGALPFGGVKNSGWGRFDGRAGIEEMLTTKAVTWVD